MYLDANEKILTIQGIEATTIIRGYFPKLTVGSTDAFHVGTGVAVEYSQGRAVRTKKDAYAFYFVLTTTGSEPMQVGAVTVFVSSINTDKSFAAPVKSQGSLTYTVSGGDTVQWLEESKSQKGHATKGKRVFVEVDAGANAGGGAEKHHHHPPPPPPPTPQAVVGNYDIDYESVWSEAKAAHTFSGRPGLGGVGELAIGAMKVFCEKSGEILTSDKYLWSVAGGPASMKLPGNETQLIAAVTPVFVAQ